MSDPLADLDALIAAATPGERPSLIVQLAARLAAIGAALTQAPAEPTPAEGDHNLDVTAAAERLGVSRRFAYRHATELGGIRLGRRLVFPARGLDRVTRKGAR